MFITCSFTIEATIYCEGFSPPLFSSSEDEVQEEVDRAESEVTPPPLHTIAFKVMGTTKIAEAQEILEARDRLHQNEDVPVNPKIQSTKMQSHLNVGLIVSGLSLDTLYQKSQINCILQCTTTLLWL